MKYLIIAIVILVQACTLGPLNVTHEKGHLPKFKMNTGYEACKVKFKYRDAVTYDCKWDVTI